MSTQGRLSTEGALASAQAPSGATHSPASPPAPSLTSTPAGSPGPADRPRKRALRSLVAVAKRPGLTLSVLWLAVVTLATIAPAVLAPADPLLGVPAQKLLPPSGEHWFGTDQVGRDLFTRVVHGSALTLQAAAVAVSVGVAVGSLLGLIAGYAGSFLDDIVMRAVDVLLSIPSLLLALALITVLGPGTLNVAIAVGVSSVAAVARIMRSEVLRVRSSLYVEAARVAGNTPVRTLVRHVLPNSAGPVVVLAMLEFATAILAVSALSFLGYGAQPPEPEWGSLVSSGRDFLRGAWWLTTFPGLVIALTVLAANTVSRALDAPRKRSQS